MFDVRKLMTEYSTDVDEVSYLVDSLWITLKTHMVMAAFVENGLKYNTTISASFIRFLTRQTGSNVSAGVGGSLKTTKKDLLAEIAKATTLANGAKTLASSAESHASTNSNKLVNLFAKNPTLTK